ncbi:MAG: monothiol glutaredoxin, Grx4 family [Legionellales bacterium]|nr:monothiol glutaredoxin, Grx4 family [Legionellales bacterium]
MSDASHEIISNTLESYSVVLYMKGTPDFPQCGFSYRVAEILKQLNVEFHSVNVLEDEAIRAGIKTFSQWPTIPQLYIKGTLIGGCDIVTTLYESGELAAQLESISDSD